MSLFEHLVATSCRANQGRRTVQQWQQHVFGLMALELLDSANVFDNPNSPIEQCCAYRSKT
jgi:hypothetical protein